MRIVALIAITAALAAPGLAQAQVYKCKSGGKMVYSDAPCHEGTEAGKVNLTHNQVDGSGERQAVARDKLQAEFNSLYGNRSVCAIGTRPASNKARQAMYDQARQECVWNEIARSRGSSDIRNEAQARWQQDEANEVTRQEGRRTRAAIAAEGAATRSQAQILNNQQRAQPQMPRNTTTNCRQAISGSYSCSSW